MTVRVGKLFFFALAFLPLAIGTSISAQVRVISFGTTLEPKAQMTESQQLAKTLANPASPLWRAEGDQHRTYRFPDAATDVPYRVCVPPSWDGTSKLPLVMFLHGAGNDESSYLDQNNKQMVTLAAQHGFILVSPLGYNGAYGTILHLPAVFGQQAEADKMIAARTPEVEHTQQVSERDVINVLELVLNEYPIDRSAMFLTGHSMGSGGTWYHGAKYRAYWSAMAPMSGPFVEETGYAWDSIRTMPVFMTEGTLAATPAASRLLRDWMNTRGYRLKYKEVNADHPGMVPLVLPDVFNFFDSLRNIKVAVSARRAATTANHRTAFSARYRSPSMLRMSFPSRLRSSAIVSILDPSGREHYSGAVPTIDGEAWLTGIKLPAGAYYAWIKAEAWNGCAKFMIDR